MKTVLIVDDEKSFLLSIVDGLQDYADDFKVLTVENGKKALECLEYGDIDLVVTDIKMPEMDGIELLTHMNNRYPSIPVMVMTAFGTEDIEMKVDKLGALSYLEKPLDLNGLADKIFDGLALGSKGKIQGITLSSFLQLLSMEKKSCVLNIKYKNKTGYLFFNKGSLIDAITENINGLDAAHKIISWENVEIEIDNSYKKRKKSIDTSLNGILMEAMRLKDENTVKDRENTHKGHQNNLNTNINNTRPNKLEVSIMSVQEKLKEFAAIEGFGGVGIFTPAGESLAMFKSGEFKSDLKEIGVLANNVLMNAQKAARDMGVGRGQLVHVEADEAHFIVRCMNEGDDPLKSQPGKAHVHLVLILTDDSSIGMAKIKVNSIIKSLAEDFRV